MPSTGQQKCKSWEEGEDIRGTQDRPRRNWQKARREPGERVPQRPWDERAYGIKGSFLELATACQEGNDGKEWGEEESL